MPNFQYIATDAEGRTLRGVLEAESKEQLALQLQSEGLFLSSFHVVEDVPSEVVEEKIESESILSQPLDKITPMFVGAVIVAICVVAFLVGYFFSPWKSSANKQHSHFVNLNHH